MRGLAILAVTATLAYGQGGALNDPFAGVKLRPAEHSHQADFPDWNSSVDHFNVQVESINENTVTVISRAGVKPVTVTVKAHKLLAQGKIVPKAREYSGYLWGDMRKDDYLILAVVREDDGCYVAGISIRFRPGGLVPAPSVREPGGYEFGFHYEEVQNDANAWREDRTPIPDKYFEAHWKASPGASRHYYGRDANLWTVLCGYSRERQQYYDDNYEVMTRPPLPKSFSRDQY